MQSVGYRPERFGVSCVPLRSATKVMALPLCVVVRRTDIKLADLFQVLSHSIR